MQRISISTEDVVHSSKDVTRELLDRFIVEKPLTVGARCVADCLMGDELDDVFEQCRSRQYGDTIKFSTVAISMAEIALGTLENRNQAYHEFQEELQVSRAAYYGKTNRTEPSVSEGVVEYSARRAAELMQHLDFQPDVVLPGYRAISFDGNHLSKTEKRLNVTRRLSAAALPGTVVARYDHQTSLFDRAYLLEDAHAQECTVLERAIEDIKPNDLVIADRHFCIQSFLLQIADCDAAFAIRHHGRLKGHLSGKREYVGRTETGKVYEQTLELTPDGRPLSVRRVTVELDKPTRDGDKEIHILSNVPAADADACQLADIYRQRWEIENGFYTLTMAFTCELKTNVQPGCALLQFCVAMLAFNCRQVILAALAAEHDAEDVDNMSQYQTSLDTVRPMDGLLTAIHEDEWSEVVPQDVAGTAEFLRQVARHVDPARYRKSRRGPKKPRPKRTPYKNGGHVSTKKLLEADR